MQNNKKLKCSDAKRYVEFTDSGIYVDVVRYLKTPEGQATLTRLQQIEKSSEMFREKL